MDPLKLTVIAAALARDSTSAAVRTRAGRALARRRAQKLGRQRTSASARAAATALWDAMTPEQRHDEMSRRRKLGVERQRAERRARLRAAILRTGRAQSGSGGATS